MVYINKFKNPLSTILLQILENVTFIDYNKLQSKKTNSSLNIIPNWKINCFVKTCGMAASNSNT